MLSGDMADIFSNLYLALSVKYYQENRAASIKLTNYIVNRLINENQEKINKIIDNMGTEKFLVKHLKGKVKSINYQEERDIFQEIMNNKNIIKEIRKNIHIHDNILADMERFNKLSEDGIWDEDLEKKIINVGEYNN